MHKNCYRNSIYLSIFLKKKKYFLLILIALVCGLNQRIAAQPYYPKAPEQGILGTMYNPFPYGIFSVETMFHGSQPIVASVYLPFYDEEKYNFPGIIPIPLASPYTSAVALCAEKGIGVYAPVEVAAGVGLAGYPGIISSFYPFAGIVNAPAQVVPFNQLKTLNEYDPAFSHPFDSKVAVSILEATQKFNQFTHDFYGWNGYDKEGNQVISSVVNDIDRLTGYYPPTKQIFYSTTEPKPLVSRDVVGHEISHGILHENQNLYPNDPEEQLSEAESQSFNEIESIIESFCDIMGLASLNWYENQFKIPSWSYAVFYNDPDAWRPFDFPKLNKMPNAYKGKFYKQAGELGYKHINASVMNHWFYILVNGKAGYVDDDITKEMYQVYPVGSNKQESYKLALGLVFFTGTQLINFATGFEDMREKTLLTMELLDYPPGSFEYIQVQNAWHAVGVGPKWIQEQHNLECDLPAFEAETWYNGLIKFNGLKLPLRLMYSV